MFQTFLKDLKIASFAGSLISFLAFAKMIVLVTVTIIFASQILNFVIKEKQRISDMG